MKRHRYLLAARRHGSPPTADIRLRTLAERTGLSQIITYADGFLLLEGKGRVIDVSGDRFRILGFAHERGDAENPPLKSRPRFPLLGKWWGQFVAIGESRDGRMLSLLRDPSGFMPCYYAQTADAIVATSDVELLFRAGLVEPIIDQSALGSHLRAETLRTAQTCFKGVIELYPGEALMFGAGVSERRRLWSPFDHVGASMEIRDPAVAASGLRRVIDSTVSTLAGPFSKALLALSGGLDSSIVACALANSGKSFECITLSTQEAAGDERAFARPMAAALDTILHEDFEDTGLIDLTHSDSLYLPRPVSRSFSQSADRLQAKAGRAIGADAFFHGGGGDNVFCYMTSSRVITDRLMRDGMSGAWKTSLDMVDLTGGSLWEAWRGALRRRWLQSAAFRWPRNALFLREEALPPLSDMEDHPWLLPGRHCLPGKALHVAWLVGIANRLEGYGREREFPIVAPLLAQPVVEYCLRIPTWLWCRNGINRAIARDAYADMLPATIATRTTKGTPSAVAFRLIEGNRALLRDRLAGGQLADWGIVDREHVLRALSQNHHLTMDECVRLSLLNDTESWVRGWQAKSFEWFQPASAGSFAEGSGIAKLPILPASHAS